MNICKAACFDHDIIRVETARGYLITFGENVIPGEDWEIVSDIDFLKVLRNSS